MLICNDCTYCIRSTKLCAVNEAPDINGKCEFYEHDGSRAPSEDEELAVDTERVAEDESVEQPKKVKLKPKNRGGRTPKPIDFVRFKKEYESGKSLKVIGGMFGFNESGIHYRIEGYIKSGVLKRRIKEKKPVTKKPTTNGAELFSTSETLINKEPASQEAKVIPASFQRHSSAIPAEESDQSFIEDLLVGADKIIIYRKSITVTIEFNKPEVGQ